MTEALHTARADGHGGALVRVDSLTLRRAVSSCLQKTASSETLCQCAAPLQVTLAGFRLLPVRASAVNIVRDSELTGSP